MKHVSATAQKVIDFLSRGLANDGARKLEAAGFMSLAVQMIGPDFVSLAHRFEMNGDLVPDPDVTFWRGPDHLWYPASIAQAINGGAERAAIRFGADGKPSHFDARLQRDIASFVTIWMRNVVDQYFGGKLPRAALAASPASVSDRVAS